MGEDVDRVRNSAQGRVSEYRGMLVTGDVIEQLAQAHELHAERLTNAIRHLVGIGRRNDLGDTGEGRTVTANYRQSAVDGDQSFLGVVRGQAAESRRIAQMLRKTGDVLESADDDSATEIAGAPT